ncbi:unnamed protein product, partial [Ascophyllum nodosum]
MGGIERLIIERVHKHFEMRAESDEFFWIPEGLRTALAKEIRWTPPGWPSSPMLELHAILNEVHGDCLFNAVAMALWGLHDRNNILRSLSSMVLELSSDLMKAIFARGKK